MLNVTGLRIAVTVVLVIAFCGVAAVMRLHWVAFRKLPASAGLTPLHVALVSAGVLQWGGALAWALLDSLGNPATVAATIRMMLYGSGGLTILASLVIVGSLQRRKVKFAASTTTVTVTEVDAVSADDVSPPAPGRVIPHRKAR